MTKFEILNQFVLRGFDSSAFEFRRFFFFFANGVYYTKSTRINISSFSIDILHSENDKSFQYSLKWDVFDFIVNDHFKPTNKEIDKEYQRQLNLAFGYGG